MAPNTASISLAREAFAAGDGQTAANMCLTLISAEPGDVAAALLLGDVLLARGEPERALGCFRRAVALAPGLAAAHGRLGRALLRLNRFAEALVELDAAMTLDADHAAVWLDRGTALAFLHRLREAERSLARACALAPDDVDALTNHGMALISLQRYAAALDRLERAAALDPGVSGARWNAVLARLALGDFARGWAEHEMRWQAGQQPRRALTQPAWRGEAEAAGRTLLLHAEQGLGDTLQFCRYAPLAMDMGLRVILEVQPPLVRLLRRMPGLAAVITPDDTAPPYDLHCALMSLPLVFGTTVETIPAAVPYLNTDARARAAWRARLDALPGRKVGLVWAGGLRQDNVFQAMIDQRRSLRLEQLSGLAELAGITWISLQKGPAGRQKGLDLVDWTDELADFADTADLVAELDLVISVDTAVAHLAGGLGVPVWMLNRFDTCWRWLVGRTDSPWYPSLRLFNQPEPGDWSSVVEAVAAALSGNG